MYTNQLKPQAMTPLTPLFNELVNIQEEQKELNRRVTKLTADVLQSMCDKDYHDFPKLWINENFLIFSVDGDTLNCCDANYENDRGVNIGEFEMSEKLELVQHIFNTVWRGRFL
jgi:hypothetical protein